MVRINSYEACSRLEIWSALFRLLPPGIPGKTRLAKVLLKKFLHKRNIQLQTPKGFIFSVPNGDDPIGFHMLIDGVYEPLTVKFILDHLECGKTFVDVGANIGVFAIPAAKKVLPGGRVIAIEPSPSICPYLQENISKNGLTNIDVCQFAAFEHDNQSLDFYEAPVNQFGMGSLSAQFHNHPLKVTGRTLDSILSEKGIEHVDLLKVDVEGLEVAVFRGAKQLLARKNSPTIVFEFCDWAEKRLGESLVGSSQKILKDFGYSIWRLSDFMNHRAALSRVITNGFEMLVAFKGSNNSYSGNL